MATAKPKRPPKPRGPKPAITPELEAELCNLLQLGTPTKFACEAVGVPERTFHRYMADGEELARDREAMQAEGRALPRLSAIQERKLAFLSAVQKARGRAVPSYLQQIAKAATGGGTAIEVTREYEQVTAADGTTTVRLVGEKRKEITLRPTWQAAAWWLERTHPDHFARMERRELSGPGGGPIEETRVNVGKAAVESEAVGAAVDDLLERLGGEG